LRTLDFLFAVWALLLTPGPTNTLLALSGAATGLGRAVRLMPAELAAYLLVSVPLAVCGAELLAQWPDAARLLKLAAALWVSVLAVKLWRFEAAPGTAGDVTARRVFITTLMNPKALIIGLVLLPPGGAPEFPLHLGLFAGSVLAVAGLWVGAGALLRRGTAGATPVLFRRAAACWLAVLAIGLAGAALSA
jgi:threonine/homoserine/homoserine lactone efflux protein